jgi:hypothetical protein
MEKYNKFSDSFSDEELNELSNEMEDEGVEEGVEEESEQEDKEDNMMDKEINDSLNEKILESEEEDEKEWSNGLEEIIQKLKKEISSEKSIQENDILIEFKDDNNLLKIQEKYINKINNIDNNVNVTFIIPEKLIKTRVYTFFKCWRNGYCLNSSNTKIPGNIAKVLLKRN